MQVIRIDGCSQGLIVQPITYADILELLEYMIECRFEFVKATWGRVFFQVNIEGPIVVDTADTRFSGAFTTD